MKTRKFIYLSAVWCRSTILFASEDRIVPGTMEGHRTAGVAASFRRAPAAGQSSHSEASRDKAAELLRGRFIVAFRPTSDSKISGRRFW